LDMCAIMGGNQQHYDDIRCRRFIDQINPTNEITR